MAESKCILVTGATGQVGHAIIRRLLSEPAFDAFEIWQRRTAARLGQIDTFQGIR